MNLLGLLKKEKKNKTTKCNQPIIAKNNQIVFIPEKVRIPEIYGQQAIFLSACKQIQPITDYIAYYKNGILFNVNPRNVNISLDDDRGIANTARYIYSEGVKYDLESPESIKQIIIPKFENDGYVTRDLSYILKMRAIRENRPALAVPLCYKVANLMLESPIAWSKKDYFRLVIQLWSIGEIAFGDYLLSELKKFVPEFSYNDPVDDRTDCEKQCYEKRSEDIEKSKKADAQYYDREHWINKYKEQYEYQQVVNLLRENAPKSYSEYARIKKNNTKKFQTIIKLAEDNGIEII